MRTTLIRLTLPLVVVAAALFPNTARAADVNEVAGGFTKKNPYDFRLTVQYIAKVTSAALNREYMGNAPRIEIVRDLIYQSIRHEMYFKAEFAIYKDFSLYLGIPLILSWTQQYKFHKGSNYVGYPAEAQCRADNPTRPWICNPDGVNLVNSRFVQDGLAAGLPDFSYDDVNNSLLYQGNPVNSVLGPGEAGPRTLFKSPKRSGLDQIHIGLQGLILSQKRHSSLPDWRLGLEFRIAAGKHMDFKRGIGGHPDLCGAPSQNNWNCRPPLNSAVGRGIHELRFFITLSKFWKGWKNGGIDTFAHFWYQLPFAYTSKSFYDDKLDFSRDYGEESRTIPFRAPQRGGVHFGGEFLIWQHKAQGHRISIELAGRIEGAFEGRDYTEAYELLAGAPTLNMDCTNPNYAHMCPDVDLRDRLFYFPGLTENDTFARFGFRFGFHLMVARYIKLTVLYSLMHEQEHFLTNDDAGEDNLNGPGGNPCDPALNPGGCANGRVDIGTLEQNPWHRPVIHQAGHRIRIQETLKHTVWIGLRLYL